MTAIRIRAVKKKNCMACYRGNLLKTLMHTGIKSIVMYVRQKDRMRVDKSREEYLSDCICPPTKRNLTLMRCITYHGIGKSCVVDGSIYQCRKVYFHDIWKFVAYDTTFCDFIFQDDNATVHRARIVHFRRNMQLKSMNSPAQSPDLNISENCWWWKKRELQ